MKELWLTSYLDTLTPNNKALLSGLMKTIIWIIPVFVLVRLMEKQPVLSFLGLQGGVRKGLKWAFVIIGIMGAYFYLVNIVMMGKDIHVSLSLHTLLNTVILAGLLEEIVFRGYILNKWINGLSTSTVDKSDSFWSANMYTSIFFVLIHFPIWLRTGQMVFPSVIGSIANIFLLSLLFGYLYKKTNSLWTVIIIHGAYNLFIVMFS